MKLSELLTEQELNELNFYGSTCTKNCGGHKAGYEWARSHLNKPCISHSPSFVNGCNIAKQHLSKGRNPIGTGIRGERGRYQKYQP